MIKPGRATHLLLWLVVLSAVLALPRRLNQLRLNWPVIRQWGDPAEQNRLTMGAVPYDALVAADALLPPEAGVLLITPGTGVRQFEYTTFHRALYYLAPRPVWWLAPVPPDGTWESRWWHYAPLTAAAIEETATARGVHCLLARGVSLPPVTGAPLARWDEVTLWQLPGAEASCTRPEQPAAAGVSTADLDWPFRLLLALAFAPALGSGALGLARRWGLRPHPLETAVLAALLGGGLLSLLLFWFSAFTPVRMMSLTTFALLSVSVFLRHRAAGQNAPAMPPPADAAEPTWKRAAMLFLSALLLFYAIYVLLLAAGRPFTIWDSWVNWSMKARIIFREGGITPALYADPSRAVALLDYPLMLPLLEAWLFRWLGVADERLAGLLFWLFYLALPLLVYGTGRRRGASRLTALLAATAVATVGNFVGLAASAFTDLLLAVLVAVAALQLAEWLDGRPAGTLLTGALAAGLLPWVKREGLIMLAILCLVILLLPAVAALLRRPGLSIRRSLLAIAACVLAGLLLAGPWWLLAAREAATVNVFLPLTPAVFFANLHRLPTIAWLMARQLLRLEFGFFWLLALPAGVLSWRTGHIRSGAIHLLPAVAFFYPAVMALSYIFSDFEPYQQHVLTSAFRLGAQVMPLLLLWLAFAPLKESHHDH